MATATIRPESISTVHALITLIKPLGLETKTALLENLQKMVKREKKVTNKEKLFNQLCGVWANDGLTADEEVEMIYSARTQGKTRIIEQL